MNVALGLNISMPNVFSVENESGFIFNQAMLPSSKLWRIHFHIYTSTIHKEPFNHQWLLFATKYGCLAPVWATSQFWSQDLEWVCSLISLHQFHSHIALSISLYLSLSISLSISLTSLFYNSLYYRAKYFGHLTMDVFPCNLWTQHQAAAAWCVCWIGSPIFPPFFLKSYFFASPGAFKREVPARVGDGVTYEHFERADELRTFHTVSISNQQQMSCEHFQTGVLSEHSGSGTAEGWQPKERSLPVPRNALKSVA